MNHELVAKKFACFMKEKSNVLEGNRNGDRSPISLAWDIYSSPHQLLEMKGCCPVKPPPFSILTRKEQKDDPPTGHANERMKKYKGWTRYEQFIIGIDIIQPL